MSQQFEVKNCCTRRGHAYSYSVTTQFFVLFNLTVFKKQFAFKSAFDVDTCKITK